MRRAFVRSLLCLATLAAVGAAQAAEGPLTPGERRGRHIYLHGKSPSGRPIVAILDESTELPASAMACGSCHGPDGRGVPEGTVEPSDVRWSVLKKPRIPAEGERGRLRPAYDEALLGRAIVEGVDSARNRLGPIMPRYRFDEADLRDLIAYLKRLGGERQPGVTETAISVATAVPLSGPHAKVGELTRSVLGAYFDEINRSGGVFGRTIELQAIDSVAGNAMERLTGILDDDGAFAFVCASLGEAEREVGSRIENERVPLITPLASDASDASTPSSFFLFADLESQAVALARQVRAAAESRETCNVWLLHDSSDAAVAAAGAIEKDASALRWTIRGKTTTLQSLDPPAEGSSCDLLFLLGRGVEMADVLRRLRETTWRPRILVAGGSLDPKLFDSETTFASTVFVSVPTLPADVTEEGRRELHSLAERHSLPAGQLATQLATLTTAKLFVEGLKRAGRDLTREKLIAALDQLYQFATGLTPPITFGRGHHIGVPDAYVLAIDLERRTLAVVGARQGSRSQ